MATLYKEDDIPHLNDRVIFFDANILISIYFTISPTDWAQKNYSRVFSKLIAAENKLTFDVTIVSEVINRALRMEYKTHLRKNNIKDAEFSYKNFRDSQEGMSAWVRTNTIIRDTIFPNFAITGKCWTKADMNFLLTQQGDFNDQLIADICREKRFILLTNDADFKNADLEILSLNNNYFE